MKQFIAANLNHVMILYVQIPVQNILQHQIGLSNTFDLILHLKNTFPHLCFQMLTITRDAKEISNCHRFLHWDRHIMPNYKWISTSFNILFRSFPLHISLDVHYFLSLRTSVWYISVPSSVETMTGVLNCTSLYLRSLPIKHFY